MALALPLKDPPLSCDLYPLHPFLDLFLIKGIFCVWVGSLVGVATHAELPLRPPGLLATMRQMASRPLWQVTLPLVPGTPTARNKVMKNFGTTVDLKSGIQMLISLLLILPFVREWQQ
jgi:hypothetical protein